MAGLLDGIRVLEVAVLFNGDLVGQHFGDMGADVIKIESPAGATTCATCSARSCPTTARRTSR